MMNGGWATNTMSTIWSCKTIWQWMLKSSKRKRWKLHGNISRNGRWKTIIGRYGGCFEEYIIRLMCDRAYHIPGFGRACEVCIKSRGESGQCMLPKRLAKYTMNKKHKAINWVNDMLSKKNSSYFKKNGMPLKKIRSSRILKIPSSQTLKMPSYL